MKISWSTLKLFQRRNSRPSQAERKDTPFQIEIGVLNWFRQRTFNVLTLVERPLTGTSLQRSLFYVVRYTAVFRVVTQCSSPLTLWGGTLRDDTKNGSVADYFFGGLSIH